MRKRIVSSLLLVGLLGALGAQAYGVTQQSRQNIKHFTAFFSVAGKNASPQNDMKAAIAEKIGADCEENWLVGQSKEEALLYCFGGIPGFYLRREAASRRGCIDSDR